MNFTKEICGRKSKATLSLAEALAQGGDADFTFNPPHLGGGIVKPADLD